MSSHDDFPPLGSKPTRKPNNNNTAFSYKQATTSTIPQQPTTTTTATVIPITVPKPIAKERIETIDIGANLADKSFEKDIDEILTRGYNKGVSKIVITGTSLRSSQQGIELVKKNKIKGGLVELYSTVGVHPHEAERALGGGGDRIINQLRELIKSNKETVKAVGECGLDFNRNFSSHVTQIEMFDRQIQLGIELNLPLFIHERDAHIQFLKSVDSYCKSNTMPRSVIHCFTGTENEAKAYIALGFYIGFTAVIGQVPRGDGLRKILKSGCIPVDRILIETDCPYMTPQNLDAADKPTVKTSKFIRNEPSFLPYVLKTISQCYNIPEKEMATQIFNNTKTFFNLN